MQKALQTAMGLAAISLVLGITSRITLIPIPPGVNGLEANAFLRFTDTCLLAAILFAVLGKKA